MSKPSLFGLSERPCFLQNILKGGEDVHDKFLILVAYVHGGHRESENQFVKKFKHHSQYKDVNKQPWYRQGLSKGRGRTFIRSSITNVLFNENTVEWSDKRANNSRPPKFSDKQIQKWSQDQLCLQDSMRYSQYRSWSEITSPHEISWSQYQKRIQKYIGTGTWAVNKTICLTPEHERNRMYFGKWVLSNGHTKLYSQRFKQFREVVFQDEAYFPSKTPATNPVTKYRYDLSEVDKHVGQKPIVSRSQHSFMYSLAFTYEKKFDIFFFTERKKYKRKYHGKIWRYVKQKNIDAQLILKGVLKKQLEPDWDKHNKINGY